MWTQMQDEMAGDDDGSKGRVKKLGEERTFWMNPTIEAYVLEPTCIESRWCVALLSPVVVPAVFFLS
jgi:hypothetical protein